MQYNGLNLIILQRVEPNQLIQGQLSLPKEESNTGC